MIHSIEQGRKEDGNRSIADKIIKRIHDLEKTVENNFGRWTWELLQNAKDSVADDTREVNVALVFDNKKVSFMHNGNHFTEHDIRGLINQISSKEVEEGEKSNRVGRFGTGFITTHLLSKVVKVKGIVKTQNNEFHKFEFPLDREGATTSILAPKIETTWQYFHQSTEKVFSINNSQFNTVFTYQITNEKQRNIAKRGIDEFERLIPFVLAFIPKIGQVTILNGDEGTTLKRQPQLLHNFIVQIDKTKKSISNTIQIALCKNNFSAVAIELEPSDNSVKEIKEIPRIFCDFPLIGTEKFHFPVMLNSFHFHPQTERDGIWLRGNDDKEVQLNQSIIQQATSLYETLLTSLTNVGVKKLYYAATTKMPDVNEKYFDREWYKSKIQPALRNSILKIPLVDTVHHGRSAIELGEGGFVDFPNHSTKAGRGKLWSLGNNLKPSHLILPEEQSIDFWDNLIWDERYRLDIEQLAAFLTDWCNTISEFNNIVGINNTSFDWLNDFYEFIQSEEKSELFNQYSIVPNLNGNFKKVNEKKNAFQITPILYIDNIQDETLLDILKHLGEDWRECLIDHNIKVQLTNSNLKKQDIAARITKLFNDYSGDWSQNAIQAIVTLSEWFEYNKEDGKELFPELYRKRAELFMNTISDKESLYHLMKSKTPLSTLSEIAQAIENDPEILKIIEKRKQELAEEKERNKIGEAVEVLLAEVLKNHGFTVKKTHIGRDLIITCKGRINYDIEVKSTNTGGFVSLTPTQANAAVQKPKHYSLCVVHKNGQELTKEYVAENAKFVNNIGDLIVSKVQDVQRFNNTQNILTVENGGIGILIENPLSLKYKVNSNVWTSGTNLLNFVEKIKMMNNQMMK